MNHLIERLKSSYKKFDRFSRQQAADTAQWEIEEQEHIFTLLVMGGFIGLPAPPLPVTFELMPHMEREIQAMLNKVNTASAPLSELFSKLDIA